MIYLDSAATSLYKPGAVSRAVQDALMRLASPGRGTHRAAMEASELLYSCREEAAALFRLSDPAQVVFTFNATHALNIAIRSIVNRGDTVVVSGYEHNAVMRPLYALGADIRVAASPLFDAAAAVNAFEERLSGAKAVICTHVSNAFGFVLPIERIAGLCRDRGIPLIVDASQSAGVLEVDAEGWDAAFVAMPGHKGLMGPQGTGLLLCRTDTKPLLYGGTGNLSRERDMPAELPERLEAGTQNVCGIAGLREGMRYIRRVGLGNLKKKEDGLTARLIGELQAMPGLDVFCGTHGEQTGVVSVMPHSVSPDVLAERLGRSGVAVRAGLHCAPLAHQTAGTINAGTVRFSVSPFLSAGQIDAACEITKKFLKFGYKL